MKRKLNPSDGSFVWPPVFIVTGYSGAGKSNVLHILEDLGFFCVDNLPVDLLPSFFRLVGQSKVRGQGVALGIDVRSGDMVPYLMWQLDRVRSESDNAIKIFFLTASASVLLRRFQETRRKHPLAINCSISDAIAQEQQLLKPLIDYADIILNTDPLTVHDLKKFVRNMLAQKTKRVMIVSLVSFGFKYGVPAESNFVYDVRSLPNPYFVPELRSLTGKDKLVVAYFAGQPMVGEYRAKLLDFVLYSVKKSYEEGRSFVNVAIGCTGGRHRSVALVEYLAQHAPDTMQFLVKHRDILKDTVR